MCLFSPILNVRYYAGDVFFVKPEALFCHLVAIGECVHVFFLPVAVFSTVYDVCSALCVGSEMKDFRFRGGRKVVGDVDVVFFLSCPVAIYFEMHSIFEAILSCEPLVFSGCFEFCDGHVPEFRTVERVDSVVFPEYDKEESFGGEKIIQLRVFECLLQKVVDYNGGE